MKRKRPKIQTLSTILSNTVLTSRGCIEWLGGHRNGRPTISYKGKDMYGSRLIWALLKGDPFDKDVLHVCDNMRCMNVEHLYIGTHEDNMNDMYTRHRNKSSVLLNKYKTHCRWGHEYTEENTIIDSNFVGRTCKTCRQLKRWVNGKPKYKFGGAPAKNKEATHCIRGHLFSPENLAKTKDNRRRCKICAAIRSKAWIDRQKNHKRRC